MATLHHGHDDGAVVYVKGAPEQVMAMCSTQRGVAGNGADRLDALEQGR